MNPPASRASLTDDLVRRFASAVRAAQLYTTGHPLISRSTRGLLDTLAGVHADEPSIAIGIVGEEIVVGELPQPKASASLTDLIRRLKHNRIERITIDRGVTADELQAFVVDVASLGIQGDRPAPATIEKLARPHIRVGRLGGDQAVDGVGRDMATIRRLYADSVAIARAVWDSTLSDGMPELPEAQEVVEGLAEAVTQHRTALIALTAMKNYDDYTFTHMVNVSILTMAQARALGIEGRLLREFGLASLMHDIGKVRTPIEILAKPDELTPAEFVIVKRHPVDGAEILRRTPEMPALAPVVAFEHHMRLDGSGYPERVERPSLNLGTMLCSIADVYDAMRSKRAYQRSFPTDRILAVYGRNAGALFDQRLIRRFVQILGIYPPGNLVRLSTGEVGVVEQVHAPDPFRPRVRVLFDPNGRWLELSEARNLWETGPEGRASVVAPVDPADIGIDPLVYL